MNDYSDSEFFREFGTSCYINKEKMTGGFPLYRHDFIEVSLVLDGEGKEYINGKSYNASKGSLSVTMPWHFHTLETQKEKPIVRFICEFSMEDYLTFANIWDGSKAALFKKDAAPFVNLNEKEFNEIVKIFNDMYDIFVSKKKERQTLLYLKLIEFMISFKSIQQRTEKEREEEYLPIMQVLKYIHANFASDISLQSVSHELGIAQRSLSEQIQAYTGLEFHSLLTDIRIRNACILLGLKTPTIKYIAENTGFNSIQSFYRVFKKMKGISPDEFRQQHWKESEGKAGYLMATNEAWEASYYMHKNFSNDIKPIDVAEHLGISVSYLHKMIKYNFMQSFNDMLKEIRIEYSCGLLTGTDYSITQIAIEVGYNSSRTFNRAFQSLKDMNSSEYRLKYAHNSSNY